MEHSLVLAKLPKLRRYILQFYKHRPKRLLQLLEAKQDLSIDELVRSLDELATEDQEVITHQVPTKAVNEARNQLREYNRIHQVKEVTHL